MAQKVLVAGVDGLLGMHTPPGGKADPASSGAYPCRATGLGALLRVGLPGR